MVVTHDRPDDLRHCLDSVALAIRPFSTRVEIIVAVDPSSADKSTQSVICDFRQNLPDLALRSVYNALSPGQSGNTNTALLHADGEYVHVLHDDDQLLEAYGRTVMPILESCGYGILHLCNSWDADGSPTSGVVIGGAREYVFGLLGVGTIVPSLGIFRNYAKQPILFDERLHFVCDWDFFARHLMRSNENQGGVIRLNEPLVAYRTTTGSISGSDRGEILHHFEHIALMRKFLVSYGLFRIFVFTPSEERVFLRDAREYRTKRTTACLAEKPALRLLRGSLDQLIDATAEEVGNRNGLVLADWREQASSLKSECRHFAWWRLRRRARALTGGKGS